MSSGFRQIRVTGLKLEDPYTSQAGFLVEALDWRVETGVVTVVTGGSVTARSMLLRCLAGLERPAGGRIFYEDGGRKVSASRPGDFSGAAYLPPPGQEIFTGTTVEEELLVFAKNLERRAARLDMAERYFGTSFRSLAGRSVWELSDSQRRCLLLISQALVEPWAWICDEPLALCDGKRGEGLRSFFQAEAQRGAAVIAASAEFGPLAALAGSVLVLADRGRPVFQGEASRLPAEMAFGSGRLHKLYVAAGKARGVSSAASLLKDLKPRE